MEHEWYADTYNEWIKHGKSDIFNDINPRTSLTKLFLDHNNLTSVDNLHNLTDLHILDISNTNVKSVKLCKLTKLIIYI